MTLEDDTRPGAIPVPSLEYVMSVRLELGNAFTSPTLSSGVQYGQVDVLSGDFSGPDIRGIALPSGGDTPVVRADGVVLLDARYFLQTDDGVLIRIANRGVFRMPSDVRRRIDAGEPVDPGEYYIRTSPTFEVPLGRYDWLSRHTFVGIGRRHQTGNLIHYYRVD